MVRVPILTLRILGSPSQEMVFGDKSPGVRRGYAERDGDTPFCMEQLLVLAHLAYHEHDFLGQLLGQLLDGHRQMIVDGHHNV